MKLIWCSVLLLLLEVIHNINSDNQDCGAKPRDVVVVLDSSDSVITEEFENTKIALVNLFSYFVISPKNTRVSLVGFGAKPSVQFKFTKYSNSEQLNSAIQSYKKIGGGEVIGEALNLALTEVVPDMRTDVERVMIVICDGQNTGSLDPGAIARQIKSKNVKLFTVGIGTKMNKEVLLNISGGHEVATLTSFLNMDKGVKNIVNLICSNPPTKEPCKLLQQDLVIILDCSDSISSNDYEIAKLFVRSFLSLLQLGENKTRVAMISFSDEVRQDFDFKLDSRKKMFSIISNLTKFGTATAIGAALRVTLRQIKPTQRPGVPFNVLLITDGMNNMYPNSISEAQLLKKAGADIISLGIGTGINVNELRAISSNEKVLTAGSYDDLLLNLKTIAKTATCDPAPDELCKLIQQDLVVLLDSSQSISSADYDVAKLFLKRFLAIFELGENKTRIAMISFSDEIKSNFDFQLHNHTRVTEIINGLTKFGTGTAIGAALRVTFRQIKPKQRPGIPFNVLLITDGVNNVYPNPRGEAELLKKNGANIITLGIGKGINLDELRAISSNDKVLTINSYNDLLNNMKTIIKTVTCGDINDKK